VRAVVLVNMSVSFVDRGPRLRPGVVGLPDPGVPTPLKTPVGCARDADRDGRRRRSVLALGRYRESSQPWRVMSRGLPRLQEWLSMGGPRRVAVAPHPATVTPVQLAPEERSFRHEAVHRMHAEVRAVERDGTTGTMRRVRPGVRRSGPAHPGRERDVPHPRADLGQLPPLGRRQGRGADARPVLARLGGRRQQHGRPGGGGTARSSMTPP
jgi:hypothetical protein